MTDSQWTQAILRSQRPVYGAGGHVRVPASHGAPQFYSLHLVHSTRITQLSLFTLCTASARIPGVSEHQIMLERPSVPPGLYEAFPSSRIHLHLRSVLREFYHKRTMGVECTPSFQFPPDQAARHFVWFLRNKYNEVTVLELKNTSPSPTNKRSPQTLA